MVEVGQLYYFEDYNYFFLVLAITDDYREWHHRVHGYFHARDGDTFRVTTMRWDRTSGQTFLDEGWTLSMVESPIEKGTWKLIE